MEQIIEYNIEVIRTDVSKTYGQAAGAHFPIVVTTTDTVSLPMNISPRMSNVTKAIDATYSSDDENDDLCSYTTAHEDGDKEGTSREASKGTPISVNLYLRRPLKVTNGLQVCHKSSPTPKKPFRRIFNTHNKPKRTVPKKTKTKTKNNITPTKGGN